MNDSPQVTVVLLTCDEAENVPHCLRSVAGLGPIYVVDSGSKDGTRALCRQGGATVVEHPFRNHAEQWAWALAELPIGTEWVLALDADYVVTEPLRHRIETELPAVADMVDGIYVSHRYHFGGGPIRYGGTKRTRLCLFRHRRTRVERSDLVDSRFEPAGTTVRWREALIEYNRYDDDLSIWQEKQERYSLRLALEEELRRRGLLEWGLETRLSGNPDQRFAWLRSRWLRFPLFWRPALYFLYRYIFALGFLDGRPGFLYAALQGFWLRLVIDWKIAHLRRLELSDRELERCVRAALDLKSGQVTQIAHYRDPGLDSRANCADKDS